MYKNAADVIFGGIVYWLVGYGLSFGEDSGANAFCGVGYWAVSVTDTSIMGGVFVSFVFQVKLFYIHFCISKFCLNLHYY